MVTSQKEQLQSLIAEIEGALAAPEPTTLWIKASEVEPQRRALTRTQTYLRSLKQLFESPEEWGSPALSISQPKAAADDVLQADSVSSEQVSAPVTPGSLSSTSVTSTQTEDSFLDRAEVKSTEDLLRALRTEMTFLKSTALQPLRLEIDSLQLAKETLQQEIEALEGERSQINQVLAEQTDELREKDVRLKIDEAQLNQFLTALLERLQKSLSIQVAQQLTQTKLKLAAERIESSAASGPTQLALTPDREQQLEKMQQLQSRSDQLRIEVDSTLQKMFETLQSNISNYQVSLNEGVESMHSLGRQGEKIVRSLIDHLTTQLDQSGVSTIPTLSSNDVSTSNFESATKTASKLEEVSAEARDQKAVIDAESAIEELAQEAPDHLGVAVETDPSTDPLLVVCPSEDTVGSLNEILPGGLEDNQEDPDIESKVIPTADATFLANLTIDDLTEASHPHRDLESALKPDVIDAEREQLEELSLSRDDTVLSDKLQDELAEENTVSGSIDAVVAPNESIAKGNEADLVDADSSKLPSIDRFIRTNQPDADGSGSQLDHDPNFFENNESVSNRLADDQQVKTPSKEDQLVETPLAIENKPANWFLGIDLGTTGLSAVLMERHTHRMYELCWSVSGDSEARRFRLPTVASVDSQAVAGQLGIGVVGPAALQQEDIPLVRSLKPVIKTGIPDDVSGEPWIQWSERMSLPLLSLQTAICDLLRTLSVDPMSCHAIGLEDAALRQALTNLQGVIIGYPTNWPDTYSFNIREAVLATGLVAAAEQIFFVEDTIAALLSALPALDKEVSSDDRQLGLYNCHWAGETFVLSAGATLTEVAIANLPSDLAHLSYSDFASRSYTYAGDSVDQDIVCQLFHLSTQNGTSLETNHNSQGSADDWESLKLDQLKLPRPGEANRSIRHRLSQRLNDSALGQQALAAARDLKMMLQENEELNVQLGNRSWNITRKDLETKVFFPYVQRINRLTSALLKQKSLSSQSIKQVICTGGAASLTMISDWLRQQFPNATIIQDTYSGEYSNSCSRVAYGLANLCHYPAVLDTARHCYNDYFLLLELLRTLPEQPLPAGGIMHLLSERGVNIQACQTHLLALIEGHLPPGLVPTEGDRPLISAQTSDIENYRLLAELPLFRKQGGQIYIADFEQGKRLRSHLESLLTTKAQSLKEPMVTDALTAQVEVK